MYIVRNIDTIRKLLIFNNNQNYLSDYLRIQELIQEIIRYAENESKLFSKIYYYWWNDRCL